MYLMSKRFVAAVGKHLVKHIESISILHRSVYTSIMTTVVLTTLLCYNTYSLFVDIRPQAVGTSNITSLLTDLMMFSHGSPFVRYACHSVVLAYGVLIKLESNFSLIK